MHILPISRSEALALVKKYNSDERDIVHYLESEAVLRAIARRLGEDEAYYGMLGLLHDVDWGLTKDNPVTHLTKMPKILS
ncbi:MAG: HD family phosphohydrolase, partial [Nanoarchaeota archaeon]